MIYDLRDAAHIINYGDLFGALFAGGDDSAFTNTGNYTGQALLYGGGVLVRNAGKMSYDGYATLPAVAAATPDVVSAALISGQNILINGAAGLDDRLVNATGAVISASGGTAIYHGLAGTFRLVNRGDIYGDLNLNGQTTVVNANTVGGDVDFNAGAALFANRDLVDGSVYFSGTGNIYRGALGAVTGTIYGAGADGKYNGGAGDDSFDFTASGAKYAYGGDGDDTFTFKASGLNPKTTVIGGAGDDTLTFTTAGLISAISFAHVSSIETINLAPSGTSNITLSDALVTSAAGGGLTVNGGSAGDTINAANVVTAGDVVTIYGANGADSITAGAAKDVFVYKAALESTGPTYDTVAGANFALDRFDVSAAAGAILAINAAASGTLSAATFNTDLASDLPAAKLGAHDALLFTANGGGLSGQTFLVVDVNGTAGYQANSDLVIRLTSTTGTLSTGDFV